MYFIARKGVIHTVCKIKHLYAGLGRVLCTIKNCLGQRVWAGVVNHRELTRRELLVTSLLIGIYSQFLWALSPCHLR